MDLIILHDLATELLNHLFLELPHLIDEHFGA